ncbi:hypothetical protein FACS189494_06250 [Spirochaetia bacterium]|nr:hypothetical protein FACS189494_06250 [Spirochaetia bacterium]
MINTCVQFIDGKLYTCIVIAYIKYFNKRFNKNLAIGENDCIDIYKIKTKEEIINFLAKPVSFCKYCNIKETIFGLEWGMGYIEKRYFGMDLTNIFELGAVDYWL